MKRWVTGVLLGILWCAAGCSMHERRAPEAVDLLVSDLATEGEGGSRPAVDWWLAFGDDRLNGLVTRALTENPTLDQAVAGVRRAEALLSGRKAADLPGLNLEGSAGRARSVGVIGGISNSWSLSAAATYEVDLWGRRQALENQRRLDRDASLAALSAAMVSVSAQVADTWYLLVERRAQLALAEERTALRRERVELIAHRYSQGTSGAHEVYGARSEQAAEEAALAGYRADASVAAHALAALLNRSPDNGGESLPASSPTLFPPLSPLAAQPLDSRLILGRPDMVQALKQVEKADEAVAVSLADRFPSFSLTAGFGRSGYEWGSMAGTGPVWNVGGSLLGPLVDWGARRSMVEADRATFDEALANYRETALAAFRDASDALAGCRNGEAAVARFQEAYEAATSNTAYVKSRYLEGVSDYLDLLAARLAENEARGRLIANRRQLLSHRIGLARALGGSFSDAWATAYVGAN